MAAPLLEIFNTNRQRIGILENAFSLTEELRINSVSHFSFVLPHTDPKNELCRPFNLIRYAGGQFYRIMINGVTINENGFIEYRCEHAAALLIDDIIPGFAAIGGRSVFTEDVIRYILGYQFRPDWVLGQCDFRHQFEYGLENETLLSALFSITNTFADDFMWEFDTRTYPYRLNLRRLNKHILPEMYLRLQKNILTLEKRSDATMLCTRLYPLGAGEGINQLGIAEINNGVPFIQSPPHIIAQHGGRPISRTWIDRRYTHAESLLEAARAMLVELQEPYEEYSVPFALLGEDSFDIPEIGKVVEVIGDRGVVTKNFIVGIDYNYDEIALSRANIANRPRDIAGSIADMADRQRIEMSYSQGATNIFQDHIYDNGDTANPVPLILTLRPSMRFINEIWLDVEVRPFRMPFAVTEGGGGFTTIPTGGGTINYVGTIWFTGETGWFSGNTGQFTGNTGQFLGNTGQFLGNTGAFTGNTGEFTGQTEEFQGSTQQTTLPDITIGDGVTGSTSWLLNTPIPNWVDFIDLAGDPPHRHRLWIAHRHPNIRITIPGLSLAHGHNMHHVHNMNHAHDMTHSHNMNHAHDMTHSHNMNHSHNMAHSHSMNHNHNIPDHIHHIPNHAHQLEPRITNRGNPTSFTLRINGVNRLTINRAGNSALLWSGDIAPWLAGADGTVSRTARHLIEVVPNQPAYCMITVTPQTFIQSRGNHRL